LGGVAKQLVVGRLVLFREEPEVVSGGNRAVEDRPRVFAATLVGKALGEPEGAGDKSPLFLTILTLKPLEEAVVQLLPNGVRGPYHALAFIVDEPYPRQHH